MGINSSTRRVTVVNDDQNGVIRISESVVQKLSQTQKQQQTNESHTSTDESTLRQQTITQSLPQPQTHPNSNELSHGIPPSATAREEYQNQIRNLEKSWKSQIDELQKQNRQLWRTANDKLSANISDAEKQLVKNKCQPICRDSSRVVVDCLQTNKSQPLKCSQEVRSFVDCVHEVRKSVLNKGVVQ